MCWGCSREGIKQFGQEIVLQLGQGGVSHRDREAEAVQIENHVIAPLCPQSQECLNANQVQIGEVQGIDAVLVVPEHIFAPTN